MNRVVLCIVVFFAMAFSGEALLKFPFIKTSGEDRRSVELPVNLYDSLRFGEKAAPVVRKCLYGVPPVLMFLYGVYLWDWDFGHSGAFSFKPETFTGYRAVSGGSDKFGHMFCNYASTRFLACMFRATGSSKNRSIVEGALVDDLVWFIGELGDGFSKNYGFDPYDFLFNQFGILLGAGLEYFPVVDKFFSMKWEYLPSARMRGNFHKFSKWDITSDYNASKFVFSAKLGGIPYLSQTPLRYINIDFGYYSRGYLHPEEYPSKTKNMFLGVSINYSIAFGDALPVGYASSTLQTLFNYYHPWWDLEIKRWMLSDRPHSDF